MENTDKKKLANEKRLKAIKEWQRQRNQVPQKISIQLPDVSVSIPEKQNKVIYNNSEDLNKSKNDQLKLFDSDDDDEEDFSDCFKIRPQFEGVNGQHMLELNSELSERFKLDERFQEKEIEITKDEDPEKDKNIRILESILGHEVCKKHPIDVNSRKRRQLKRFDPEDENAVNFIKAGDTAQKKRQKKEQKSEETPNEQIPYSSERYIEVASDLKNIICSASPFNFSEKFNTNGELEDTSWNEPEDTESKHTNSLFKKELLHSATDDLELNKEAENFSSKIQRNDLECHTSFKEHFFISGTDDRLKEGINFFMRPKPLDEIREEWLVKREEVLEIFKRRKKSAQRRSIQRPKKQNQKKIFPFKK